jgi:acetyl-CoA carboxylase carboxyl transferase subunit alpha
MPDTLHQLAFEQPIYELEERIAKREAASDDSQESREEIRRMKKDLNELKRKIYRNLEPWEVVQVARHPERPMTTDYLGLVFDDFVELHGDRHFGDDRAIRCGFAKLDDIKVMFIGHQKGKTYKERQSCYFGCAHPEGYRKALRAMKMAAKFKVPIVTFIDTPGAYPGIGAEERGQSEAIAVNLLEMARLETPIVACVIGEGGSGGALGIGVADRVGILENSYYSVISPEGCAGILWKSHEFAEQAARALKMTSRDLLQLGVVDEVVEEPLGGAHRDYHQMATRLKMFLVRNIRELANRTTPDLLEQRYQKFRKMGVFEEPGVMRAEAAE